MAEATSSAHAAANAAGLDALLRAAGADDAPLPPVDRWNPPYCGDVGIEIRKDGSWWHQGGRIGREKLVRLFARILRKDEDGATYLVTPVEKVLVRVEAEPFLAVRVDRIEGPAGPRLAFTTNLGDVTVAGPDAPLRVVTDPATGEPYPTVRVRGRLDALLTRATFFELASGARDHDGVWQVESDGVVFALGDARS